MHKILTITEIAAQYDREWILIEDPITDEALEVQGGKVLLHCKDRDEFNRRMLEFKPKRSAILFMGVPQNMEFVL